MVAPVLWLAAVARAQAPESPAAAAEESELAREVENPVSKVGSIDLQGGADFGIGPYDRVRNILSIQPTFGFSLTKDVGIVSRSVVPLVTQPAVTQSTGYTSGLGDTAETLFVVPPPTGGVLSGIGPTLLLPTATANELGAGQLGLGPTAAVVMQPGPWMFGMLVGQIWSVPGLSDRPAVDQLSAKYLVAFRFPRGWYLNTEPVITANWNASSRRNRWTAPVGGGGGKVFVIAEVPLNVSVAAYWNAVRPDTATAPSMSTQVKVALLLR
jgi:hypothetical protein